MKNIVLFISLSTTILLAQFSYPAQDFLGGGIGYSPMYIKLDSIPGSSFLTGLGLEPKNFKDPFVIHGGEGFAHVTGRWRIGGYAGVGGTTISTIPDIVVFQDNNGNDTLDIGEPSKNYTKYFNPTIEAKFTFSLGAASVEYVMPLLQDLEISAGALMGLGRAGIALDQQSGNPRWADVFSNVYGTMDSTGTLFYGVDSTEYADPSILPGTVPGLLRDVSATFFNFQPYLAVKWQFLERLGLRISVGFNKGTITAGSWVLNGRTKISDSPTSAIQGASFRTMLYIGL
ncbi:MAG: hypothetical protein HOB40_02900 [Candidatus Marinimicrobia bacterium]|jgi:hypothetical protein|nr:hypothetical protein [Candidatus Neomarinimicrobiota bacterium]MBT3838382.1 hypothetical protein [Candidatus Neomarinimicrobiota bacterium]MBT3998687.1 hypothetical protein [Candidatus Neomarinimicrobiota bacterium]MBT4283266.1 hypothetical protein [Candidatus Neomarinimicrobiota bacterium]MBT4578421.1 hypothetical protein [Candidatus Neomarinimicrobiota bacterium]